MAHEHEDKRAQDLKTGVASVNLSKSLPDQASHEAQDVVRVLSLDSDSERESKPAFVRKQSARDLGELQEMLQAFKPLVTDRDRGHSVLTALLSAQLSNKFLDSHGQPLGSAQAPDPRSDSFYHDLTELTERHLLIDKTDFLSSYLGGERRFDLIARPLGMGKTVLLKIIAALYSGRRDLLPDNLAVLRDWHEAPKDVIYLDFAQMCYHQDEGAYHSYPTTEELISGPYICGTDILNRRRSQGLVAHMAELDYQFYRGDDFVATFYDQLYQQCTRLSDVKAVNESDSAAEDFSGILSSTVDRIALLQVIRLLESCQENSRVLIIDNFDAPLLSVMHLPECYNLRASLLSRLLLLLSQHGKAFRHILLSAQCAVPELGWQPNDDGEVVNSDLNSELWQSPEFATRLGFTVAELKAQVPDEVRERVYDYLSLNYAITDEDALWELFAQNFGGYSIDRAHEVLLPRLVIAQLCQPDMHFNPSLSYDHDTSNFLEPVEAMPDLDILYLHAISRLPFESLIRFFNTVLRGRCYSSPDLYQLPLTIPGYPDQIPGRDKIEPGPVKKKSNSEQQEQAGAHTTSAADSKSSAEDSNTSAEDSNPAAEDGSMSADASKPLAAASNPAVEDRADARNQSAAESEDSAEQAVLSKPEDLEHYTVRPSALAPTLSARTKRLGRRRKLSAQAQAQAQAQSQAQAQQDKEVAQDRIDAILGFGDQVQTPQANRLTPGQMMLQDLVNHLNKTAALKVQQREQSSGLDYSKVQDALKNLEIQAKSTALQGLMQDYDLVGYFDNESEDAPSANPTLANALRMTVAQANAIAQSKPETVAPQPDPTMSEAMPEELPELDANQITSAESDRQVALDVLKRKRNFENNVLQAALEHSDARAEGGFPTVNSDDLAALDRLTKKVQIGPTGIQIDENAPDEIMSEVARLDLIRTRMARARNLKHAPDKRIPFELSDLLCALGFLTYSRERTLPNINLVPNRYVYRKLRLMVLGVLFRADCPLNSKSEGKLSEALGPSKRVRREIEYDFSAALDQVEHLQTLFKFAGLGDLFQTMQGKRSNEDLRMEIGDLPDLTLDPEHFFPVKGQAPVYVPLLTNIINWLSVPGPITLSANAVNEAVALFCQLHLSHAEDLALGRDLPKMVRLVDELEVSRAESEQFRCEVEAAAQAAKQYHQAENQDAAAPEQAAELDLTQFFGSDSEEPEQANAESQDTPEDGARSEQALAPAEAGADASTEAGADASVPETPAHKSPAAVHGLFIYDEDTERDPELEAQALSELNAKDGAQADSAAPADSAAQADAAAPVLQVLTPIAGKEHASIAEQFGISWDDDTTRMLQRAHDLSLYDESWRGVNFSTRPIEDDNQARNVVQKALSSDSIDLPKALLEVASAQVRRHHNLTIYTPGSAIVIEFALAKNEEQLSQITSMALHNLVHVDSPLQTALGKSSYELETTQVQRVLLVGLVQGRRIVVRKVLVVDVNPATAEF